MNEANTKKLYKDFPKLYRGRKRTNTKCYFCKIDIYRRPSRLTDRNFCSASCRNKYFSAEKSFAWKGGKEARKIKVREYDKEKRELYKRKAVEIMGGKCNICGYNKCIGALEFHHKDPNTKEGNIKHMIVARSWKVTEREIKKCILLCSNCHKELHWGERHG